MTTTQESDRKSIKELGWRQGSILPADLVAPLPGNSNNEEEIFVVVSHDCDVTNSSLENEPMVEILKAKIRSDKQSNGALLFGKHPRRIQFEVEISGETVYAEANAHDRLFVQRKLLLDCTPDTERNCSPLVVEQVSDWLSRRYVRSAFPDTFNNRIRPAQRHIKKALSTQGQNITGIFAAMEKWDELPDNESYRFFVVATMTDDDYSDPQKREHAQKPLDKIEQRLQACDGIDVESWLASEGDISIADYRRMRRLDFDYLSLQDDDGDVAPRP